MTYEMSNLYGSLTAFIANLLECALMYGFLMPSLRPER
jgi:dolichol kinase